MVDSLKSISKQAYPFIRDLRVKWIRFHLVFLYNQEDLNYPFPFLALKEMSI